MVGQFEILDFDPEYIGNLRSNLIKALEQRAGWVDVSDIADDSRVFVDAVSTLAERGYFADAWGITQIEFGKNEERIRLIPFIELRMLRELRLEYWNKRLIAQEDEDSEELH